MNLASHAHSRRAYGLDLLRASAAVGVLLVHAAFFVWTLAEDWTLYLYFASLAVDLFFVLSGFLIGGKLIDEARGGAPDLRRFWISRWWRTLPSYFLFVVINLLVVRWSSTDWANPLAHIFFVQNLTGSSSAFFPESWSLAIEEWFYLLSPLLIFGLARGPRAAQRATVVALAVIAVGIAIRWFWVLGAEPTWDDGVKKALVARVDVIAYGLLIAALMRCRGNWFANGRLWLVTGLLLVGAGVAIQAGGSIDTRLLPRIAGFALSGLGFALCLPWAAAATAPGPRTGRVVAALARWSYALYLVHLVLIRLCDGWWVHADNWVEGVAHIALYAALAVLSAAAVYRWFERPVLAWRDRWLAQREDRAGTATAAPRTAN